MLERCETCRWFFKGEPQYTYGDCHRFPPQFNFSANFTESDYQRRCFKAEITRFQDGVWPNVHQDQFCGEWTAQPKENDNGR